MARPTQNTGGKTGSTELARAIRDRREQLGMSRQELADATGIPYPTIAQIETAYRGVSPGRLGVIARTLGLDPKNLYDLLAADSAPDPIAPARPVGPPAARRMRAAPRSDNGPWHLNPSFVAAAPDGRMGPASRRDALEAAPAFAAAEPADTALRPGPAQSTAATPAASTEPEVVEQVIGLLATLPADRRIEALGRVQTRLLAGIVEEQVQRSDDRG